MEFLSNYWAELGGAGGVLAIVIRLFIVPVWKYVQVYIPKLIEQGFNYLESKTKNEALKAIIHDAELNFLSAEEKYRVLVNDALKDGKIDEQERKELKQKLNESVKEAVKKSIADSKHIAIDWAEHEIEGLATKIVDSIAGKLNIPTKAAKAVNNSVNPS